MTNTDGLSLNRRQMMMGLSATAGAAMLGGAVPGMPGAAALAAGIGDEGFDAASGKYVLPPLPYAHDALEDAIDARTMELHHGKHHAAYVTGINNAVTKLAEAREKGDYSLVQHWSRQVAFHGGGHALHSVFWKNMAPAGSRGEPTGQLEVALQRDFGSVEAFKAHFSAAANAVEGGGWGILGICPISHKLIVLQGENQQKLTVWGMTPLLVLDVWEHAYYLRYANARAEYVKAWWSVVNWNDVAQRFAAATSGQEGA